jgi:ubiquinone biosynthesis protein UbiJ
LELIGPLRQAALKTLEHSLGSLLAMDPQAKARLVPLIGKLIEIRILAPTLHCYIECDGEKLHLAETTTRAADTVITGKVLGLARSRLAGDTRAALQSGDLSITGDLQAGAALQALFAKLDIDWEEQASRLLGDVVAHQLGNAARGLRRFGNDSADALRHDLSDWLCFELALLADRASVDTFLHEVDVLRADADRLQARIARLPLTRGKNP